MSNYLVFQYVEAATLGECAELCLEEADDVSIIDIDGVGAS